MFQSHLDSSAFVTTFHSKVSASTSERDMYLPFAEALNYALEDLSNIRVDGLPGFKAHIVFMPCDKPVLSDREMPGSSFKPDLVVMPLECARETHRLEGVDRPKVSEFLTKITGGSSPVIRWKMVLSAVEMKRKQGKLSWAAPEVFSDENRQVNIMRDTDRQLDEELGDSQPTTCKMDRSPWGHMLKRLNSGFVGNVGILQAVCKRGGDGSRR